jgi:hypothetical protein
MKSIRFLFFLSIILITVFFAFFFINSFTPPAGQPSGQPSSFLSLYGKKLAFTNPERTVLFKTPDKNQGASYTIYTGKDTSAAFLVGAHRLLLLAKSGIEVPSRPGRCTLTEGTVIWQKILKGKTELNIGSPDLAITLSESGSIDISDLNVDITTHYSPAELTIKGDHHTLEALNRLRLNSNASPVTTPILRGISEILPVSDAIILRSAKDALIHFSWKPIPETTEYRVRVFGSIGLCPLLFERIVSSDRQIIDILHFDTDRFFWDVTPYDAQKRLFGVPSKMGQISRSGRLMEETSALMPPALEVHALTTSGSMVLIEGFAQPDSELFINDVLVKKDEEGKFIYTISYNKIGQKKIIFRLVSPAEIETRLERTVTIFVE